MRLTSILVTIIFILLTGCKKTNPTDTPGNRIDSTKIPVDSSNDIKIYSISPTQGLPNATIIIKGINFKVNALDNLVKFNNDPAFVVAASKDSLIVNAPINGTTGPVTVTVSGKTATGPVFTYLKDSVLQDSVNIYAAIRGDGVIYWRNEKEFFLSSVQNNNGGAYAIAILDSDIYVAGASNNVAGVWKNGVETVLPIPDPNAISEAKAITKSGNDIYIAGSDSFTPVYWKNGVENKLPSSGGGFVNDIVVDGSDIYAAGYEAISNDDLLVYWKNGVETILGTKGIVEVGATSIALSGADVYVCGTDSGDAAYWKNGVKVILSKFPGQAPANANAIVISGNDLYVVGDYAGDPVYWKNGIKFTLPYLSAFGGSAKCITLYQSDIYIGGSDGSNAVYWKNGVEYHLPAGNGSTGYITSMVVTKP